MLHVPSLSHVPPISPNAQPHTPTLPIHPDVLSKWQVTAAMLIPGPSASESSAALVALGDSLFANQWVEAAHAWYVSLLVARLESAADPHGTLQLPHRSPKWCTWNDRLTWTCCTRWITWSDCSSKFPRG